MTNKCTHAKTKRINKDVWVCEKCGYEMNFKERFSALEKDLSLLDLKGMTKKFEELFQEEGKDEYK